jgi:hypothetical protein
MDIRCTATVIESPGKQLISNLAALIGVDVIWFEPQSDLVLFFAEILIWN